MQCKEWLIEIFLDPACFDEGLKMKLSTPVKTVLVLVVLLLVSLPAVVGNTSEPLWKRLLTGALLIGCILILLRLETRQ
jgi:hypothetical protein